MNPSFIPLGWWLVSFEPFGDAQAIAYRPPRTAERQAMAMLLHALWISRRRHLRCVHNSTNSNNK